jgi:hypothetical protein
MLASLCEFHLSRSRKAKPDEEEKTKTSMITTILVVLRIMKTLALILGKSTLSLEMKE